MTGTETDREGGRKYAARRLGDSYGLVLILTLVTLVIIGLLGERQAVKPISLLLFGAIYFLTLWASGVSRRRVLSWLIAIPVILVAAGMAGAYTAMSAATGAALAVSILLMIGCAVAIGRRLSQHPSISVRSVLGALCIYLFVGLLFAQVYRALALFGEEPFFAQQAAATGVECIYFSFVCITTLGFGDLSPATSAGQMAAIVEAVLGQLYLVTVVALFVGNLRFERRESSE